MPKLKTNALKKAKQKRFKDELHKFKKGTLHSGSRKGAEVTHREQAIAIALSEAGLSNKDKRRTAKNNTKKQVPQHPSRVGRGPSGWTSIPTLSWQRAKHLDAK